MEVNGVEITEFFKSITWKKFIKDLRDTVYCDNDFYEDREKCITEIFSDIKYYANNMDIPAVNMNEAINFTSKWYDTLMNFAATDQQRLIMAENLHIDNFHKITDCIIDDEYIKFILNDKSIIVSDKLRRHKETLIKRESTVFRQIPTSEIHSLLNCFIMYRFAKIIDRKNIFRKFKDIHQIIRNKHLRQFGDNIHNDEEIQNILKDIIESFAGFSFDYKDIISADQFLDSPVWNRSLITLFLTTIKPTIVYINGEKHHTKFKFVENENGVKCKIIIEAEPEVLSWEKNID